MSPIYTSRERAVEIAERLRVYAHPLRIVILSRLLRGECSVGEIEETTNIGQPTLSQQLAELRRAHLVETRRESKQIHYRLADEATMICVRSLEAAFGEGREILREAASPDPAARVNTPLAGAPGAAAFARIG